MEEDTKQNVPLVTNGKSSQPHFNLQKEISVTGHERNVLAKTLPYEWGYSYAY